MNNLTTNQTMSSREIAQLTGKNHKEVMRAIRTMEPAWEKVRGRKFALTFTITQLPNGATRKDPVYELSKTESLYIATKFNDEARACLVIRWEELERIHKALAYHPESVEELTQDFLNLMYKELVRIPNQRMRVRMAGLIEYYTAMITAKPLKP
jgi:phage regulator Rha-like protein